MSESTIKSNLLGGTISRQTLGDVYADLALSPITDTNKEELRQYTLLAVDCWTFRDKEFDPEYVVTTGPAFTPKANSRREAGVPQYNKGPVHGPRQIITGAGSSLAERNIHAAETWPNVSINRRLGTMFGLVDCLPYGISHAQGSNIWSDKRGAEIRQWNKKVYHSKNKSVEAIRTFEVDWKGDQTVTTTRNNGKVTVRNIKRTVRNDATIEQVVWCADCGAIYQPSKGKHWGNSRPGANGVWQISHLALTDTKSNSRGWYKWNKKGKKNRKGKVGYNLTFHSIPERNDLPNAIANAETCKHLRKGTMVRRIETDGMPNASKVIHETIIRDSKGTIIGKTYKFVYVEHHEDKHGPELFADISPAIMTNGRWSTYGNGKAIAHKPEVHVYKLATVKETKPAKVYVGDEIRTLVPASNFEKGKSVGVFELRMPNGKLCNPYKYSPLARLVPVNNKPAPKAPKANKGKAQKSRKTDKVASSL